MADDQNQRPYRSNEAPTRGPAAKVAGNASGSDPLAELARLIGQNDPFSEYGRDAARRAAPQSRQPEPTADWAPPAALPPAAAPAAQTFGAQNFGRQPFGGAPLAGGGDLYQVAGDAHGHAEAHAGYEHDHQHDHEHDNAVYAHLAAEGDEHYEDVPSHRRRLGIMAIAGVFALAVIGTAGAFGYRALFGTSSSSLPPPVIKADTAPSKIVPSSPGKDSPSSKLITDRVNERGQGEKLVSREETPVPIKDKPANVFPQAQDNANPSAAPQLGNGVVGAEPKRIRTIAIHPEGQGNSGADTTAAAAAPPPPPAPAQAQAPARTAAATPPRPAAQPMRLSDTQPASAAADLPPPRPQAARPAPVRVAAARPAAGNAPLSLSPDAPPQAPRAAPPKRPAAAAQPTQLAAAPASGGSGSYAVQVSSQRSEAEAQAAFRSLQGKYPGQLGGKQVLIRKVDLGAKGTYYRAMVGPFANAGEAGTLCSSLKSAGGQCIVQKN